MQLTIIYIICFVQDLAAYPRDRGFPYHTAVDQVVADRVVASPIWVAINNCE